nr:MAG TPA: hypothetical protein [Caudoviricetes sp.]
MKKVEIKKLGVILKISDDEFKKSQTRDLIDKDTGKFLYKAKTISFQKGNIYMIINENLFEDIKEND